MVEFLTKVKISFIKILNKTGPKIDPLRNSFEDGFIGAVTDPNFTHWLLLERYDCTRLMADADKPYSLGC